MSEDIPRGSTVITDLLSYRSRTLRRIRPYSRRDLQGYTTPYIYHSSQKQRTLQLWLSMRGQKSAREPMHDVYIQPNRDLEMHSGAPIVWPQRQRSLLECNFCCAPKDNLKLRLHKETCRNSSYINAGNSQDSQLPMLTKLSHVGHD